MQCRNKLVLTVYNEWDIALDEWTSAFCFEIFIFSFCYCYLHQTLCVRFVLISYFFVLSTAIARSAAELSESLKNTLKTTYSIKLTDEDITRRVS